MSYTLRGLLEQLEAVDTELAVLRESMYHEKLAEARALVEEYGFTAYELGLVKTQHIIKRGRKEAGTFRPKAKPTRLPALYRDPATGQTWSGRGRPPAWLDGDRDEYRIKAA